MFKFKNYTCVPKWGHYKNGQIALHLIDPYSSEEGELVATASVCLEDRRLSPEYVYIKNYSENEGLLEALVEAGVVADTKRVVQTGYTAANICLVLNKENT